MRWAELSAELEEILADPEATFRAPEVLLKNGNSSTVVARGDFVIKQPKTRGPRHGSHAAR